MREFSKPSELVQKQQPGSVRRMLFRLLFLFLLLKGFGRFAAFHLAELFLAQILLLGFILTKVGFWAATSSSLVALRCHWLPPACSLPHGTNAVMAPMGPSLPKG